MPILTDFDPSALINELSFSLPRSDRESFCAAAADALAQLSCPGPGAAYRALVPLQRRYFHPPDIDRPPVHYNERKLERLEAAPAIATGRDKRRTRNSMR